MTRKIHLIFKTHLDVGFTNYASVVVQSYSTKYIPDALALACQMRQSRQSEGFIWTTGSWLIYEYLEQASPIRRREMEEAIQAGDIAWHALPFTTHTELMDADLFRLGLSLSQRLDARFGKHTIAAKFTDVPGHTRAIIPLLAEAGVKFLHIGVNPGSTVPAVPPLFRWQAPGGEEVIVMYESGYGSAFIIPGIEDALAFGHSIDNLGPQTQEQVVDIYQHLQAVYPDARIFASTLNAFAEQLEPIRSSLPVVINEIGDTWIHGIGSDPIKVSQYRELLRLRTEWLASDPVMQADPLFDHFQRRLLLVPEHTWGMDEKTFLGDHEHYSAAEFSAARELPNFRIFEASWAEKRSTISAAVDALEDTPLGGEARARLGASHPHKPDLAGWDVLPASDLVTELPTFTIQFDPQTGAITRLVDHKGKEWADPTHPLAWLRYQTFSAEDYERFFRRAGQWLEPRGFHQARPGAGQPAQPFLASVCCRALRQQPAAPFPSIRRPASGARVWLPAGFLLAIQFRSVFTYYRDRPAMVRQARLPPARGNLAHFPAQGFKHGFVVAGQAGSGNFPARGSGKRQPPFTCLR
jgi:hypothetical protein